MLCSRCWRGKGVDGGEHSGAVLLETGGNSLIFICCSEEQQEGFLLRHAHYGAFGSPALFCKMVVPLQAIQICLWKNCRLIFSLCQGCCAGGEAFEFCFYFQKICALSQWYSVTCKYSSPSKGLWRYFWAFHEKPTVEIYVFLITHSEQHHCKFSYTRNSVSSKTENDLEAARSALINSQLDQFGICCKLKCTGKLCSSIICVDREGWRVVKRSRGEYGRENTIFDCDRDAKKFFV